ncbi:MAG: polysaccharide deacetylase family protein [Alphaproteobacteria bacterium]
MSAWENLSVNLRLLLSGGILALILAGGAAAQDHGQASVFIYHRFGEMDFPTTSVSIAQLEAHIAELKFGRYQVMALEAIVDTMAQGKPLPEHAVAITIDDGFVSTYLKAWPRLRAAGLPFTIFISTDSIDERQGRHMSWDQVREMLAGGGVGIGHHSAAHQHMPTTSQAANDADLARAAERFRAELGLHPVLFAYPYGEFSRRDRNQIAGLGFKAAFGQQSGVVHSGSDRFSLPRFAMNVHYASRERFALAANALPLPARDITPEDSVLGPENNPPVFGFTVPDSLAGLDRLNCYASNQNAAVPVQRLGENRIEVRMATAFAPGRGRINCTLPDRSGRWRWLGQAFVIP